MANLKDSVRPMFEELRGYLSAVPDKEVVYDELSIHLSKQFNETIEELTEVSGNDYSKFKVQAYSRSWNGAARLMLNISDYRNKLSGIINRIQGEFFFDEQSGSSGPSTVINQTQTQTQSITTILEIQEKIITELPKHAEGTKERSFLEKVKAKLPTISSGMDLLSNILEIGKEFGLHASEIHSLLNF